MHFAGEPSRSSFPIGRSRERTKVRAPKSRPRPRGKRFGSARVDPIERRSLLFFLLLETSRFQDFLTDLIAKKLYRNYWQLSLSCRFRRLFIDIYFYVYDDYYRIVHSWDEARSNRCLSSTGRVESAKGSPDGSEAVCPHRDARGEGFARTDRRQTIVETKVRKREPIPVGKRSPRRKDRGTLGPRGEKRRTLRSSVPNSVRR